MKKLFIIACIAITCINLSAQKIDPVNWKFEAKKKTANEYEIVATATVAEPWHIYSQNTGKGGPIATSFSFARNPLIQLNNKLKENGKLEKVYDKNFKTDVLFYANSVVFTQTAKVKGNIKTNVSGTVEYMVCNDEQCLPPVKKSFNIQLQ